MARKNSEKIVIQHLFPAEVVLSGPGVGLSCKYGGGCESPTRVERDFQEAGIRQQHEQQQHGGTKTRILQQHQHDDPKAGISSTGVEERAARVRLGLVLLLDGESSQLGPDLPSCEEEDRVQRPSEGRL